MTIFNSYVKLPEGIYTYTYIYIYTWLWVNTYRYIFRGMNIHLPAILMFTRGTRFWHTAIWKIGYHIPILFKSYAQVPDAKPQCGSEDVRLLWSHQRCWEKGISWRFAGDMGMGQNPCTPGEPENSWDLWMFIPLKCIYRYWPIAISLGILAFYWPQNASNLLCFSWILNEIDSIFLDRKLWTKTCARRLGTLVLPCNMSRSAETQGLKISPDPQNSTYFYIAHRIHVWYIC